MAIFKIGDNAVYPGRGVGTVIAIESKEIFGSQLIFYSLEILENGKKLKVMVPQKNVESVGLRPIISEDEAQKVLDILKETEVKVDNQTWNRRYRDYMDKIKTGSAYKIAQVLRDLYLLKVNKELSFGERNMLKKARELLLSELSIATSKDSLKKEENVAAIFEI